MSNGGTRSSYSGFHLSYKASAGLKFVVRTKNLYVANTENTAGLVVPTNYDWFHIAAVWSVDRGIDLYVNNCFYDNYPNEARVHAYTTRDDARFVMGTAAFTASMGNINSLFDVYIDEYPCSMF